MFVLKNLSIHFVNFLLFYVKCANNSETLHKLYHYALFKKS